MKCLLIYNKTSGKGKFAEEIPMVKQILKENNHEMDCFLPESKEDLIEQASIKAKDYDCYLIAGGDGTVNNVVNGIMKSKYRPKILIIPRGTANDLAGIFGIKKDLKQNLSLLETEPIKTDIGKINDMYFSYAISCGAFSDVTYDIERKQVQRFGYFAYLKQAIKRVGKNKRIPISVNHDIGTEKGNFCLLLLLNSKRVAGFNLRLYSEAKMNDGILEMRLLRSFGFFNLMKIVLFFLLSGKLNRRDKHLISRTFHVEVSDNVRWNIDGEQGPSGNVTISVLKEEIPFFATEKSKKKNYLQKK